MSIGAENVKNLKSESGGQGVACKRFGLKLQCGTDMLDVQQKGVDTICKLGGMVLAY